MKRLLPPLLISGALVIITIVWMVQSPPAGDGSLGDGSQPATAAAAAPARPVTPPVPPDELVRLVTALRSAEDPTARQQAAHAIALKGPAAAGAADDLARIVAAEQDPEVRRKLIWTLGELRAGSTTGALLGYARDAEDPAERRQAIAAAVRCRQLTVPEIVSGLDSEEDGDTRGAWIRALDGRVDAPLETRLLAIARNDGSPQARAAAIEAVAGRVDDTAAPAWTVLADRLQNDGSALVRGVAGAALLHSERPEARAAVEQAIARERDPETQRTLRELLDLLATPPASHR